MFTAAHMEAAADRLSPFVGAGLIIPRGTRNPAEVLNNGTVSFINTGQRRILVTCAHVYDEFVEKRRENPNIGFVLAGANGVRPVDISDAPVIDHDRKHLDLVTLELPRVDLLLGLHKQFFTSPHWPPPRPQVDDAIAGLGFPGKHRAPSGRGLELRMTPIVLTVSSVSDRHFVLADDASPRSFIRLNSQIPDEVVFGGMSGSSVYIWEPDRQDFRLGGFFYEAADRLDAMMYVVHAEYIRGDGTFDRAKMPW